MVTNYVVLPPLFIGCMLAELQGKERGRERKREKEREILRFPPVIDRLGYFGMPEMTNFHLVIPLYESWLFDLVLMIFIVLTVL